MKLVIVFAAVILAVSAATDREQWLLFKANHGKEYRNLREEQQRYTIFQQNLRKIEEHNAKYENGESSYYLGVNNFADWSASEFAAYLNTTQPDISNLEIASLDHISEYALPATVDWRDRGVVTGVKNQGQCGSCWSFAATGALEGAYALKTGKLISLSEQNLVDCSTKLGNAGCNGGVVAYGIEYAVENGIETEADYPYTAKDGSCHFVASKSVFKAQRYVGLRQGSEDDLQKAVAEIAPVAVSLNADSFQLYNGGVLDVPSCSTSVNHGVLVVGYGTLDGKAYWLVKNSWGATWGDKGYLKMSRNKSDQCGIALYGVYAVV